jgi:hypothetical protein
MRGEDALGEQPLVAAFVEKPPPREGKREFRR